MVEYAALLPPYKTSITTQSIVIRKILFLILNLMAVALGHVGTRGKKLREQVFIILGVNNVKVFL